MKQMGNIYLYKTSVLQIETSVSPRFCVILTGIQGAILEGQNPLFKTSQKYFKHVNLVLFYCWGSVIDSHPTLSIGPIL